MNRTTSLSSKNSHIEIKIWMFSKANMILFLSLFCDFLNALESITNNFYSKFLQICKDESIKKYKIFYWFLSIHCLKPFFQNCFPSAYKSKTDSFQYRNSEEFYKNSESRDQVKHKHYYSYEKAKF